MRTRIKSTISGMCSVAFGSMSGARMPKASNVEANRPAIRTARDSTLSPLSAAAAMILSSMSVMFRTKVTSKPLHTRYLRITSNATADRP